MFFEESDGACKDLRLTSHLSRREGRTRLVVKSVTSATVKDVNSRVHFMRRNIGST